jgi:L-lactate dehydrogenase complex protein LldF
MENEARNLREEISEKLKDETLRGALGRFAEVYPEARAKAYENAGDIDTLRDAVRQMKIATVAQIEEVTDRFETEATKRGVKVFRAKNGDDLNAYLVDLCKKKGVKRVIKSKSMASEEVHLNPHLEAAGITVTETDLGEWIVAIAGQKPSHMVIPAIHLNRFQVAEYFTKELEEAIPPDIDVMVRVARKELREKFLRADMGISGANFAIAEKRCDRAGHE